MTVLVAFDGSDPAWEALEFALEDDTDEPVVVLRVIEVATSATDAGLELVRERYRERHEQVERDNTDELEAVLDRNPRVSLETTVDDPARGVVRYAEEHDVDHIVVGSHGRGGLSRVLLGSVAETIVRRAPCPVTVARPVE